MDCYPTVKPLSWQYNFVIFCPAKQLSYTSKLEKTAVVSAQMTVEWRMQNPNGSDPDSAPHQCTQRTVTDAMQTYGNTCIAKEIIAVWGFFKPDLFKAGRQMQMDPQIFMEERISNPK